MDALVALMIEDAEVQRETDRSPSSRRWKRMGLPVRRRSGLRGKAGDHRTQDTGRHLLGRGIGMGKAGTAADRDAADLHHRSCPQAHAHAHAHAHGSRLHHHRCQRCKCGLSEGSRRDERKHRHSVGSQGLAALVARVGRMKRGLPRLAAEGETTNLAGRPETLAGWRDGKGYTRMKHGDSHRWRWVALAVEFARAVDHRNRAAGLSASADYCDAQRHRHRHLPEAIPRWCCPEDRT
ncbi:hypothetical protein IE53DRAFT_37501 [Violaceomyces palustris]|uniref:Uncharacterized protein n=1 Tax=Violaceomyces palustris TaxID=1673888 RepID=A0ACD0P164_9BASI|nr:hypothetical protein IE53DRAFT_37501 [Violaceomyces palustris]